MLVDSSADTTADQAAVRQEYLPLRLRTMVLALLSTSIAINLIDRQALSVVDPALVGCAPLPVLADADHTLRFQ